MSEAGSYPYARRIPLEKLRKNEANPNQMTDAVFNSTVKSLEAEGWLEPVTVVPGWDGPVDDREPDFFRIVGGHHRVDAAGVLGWEEAECWVLDPAEFNEDRQKWSMVKLNIIKGQLNSEKFARLYEEMAARYSAEVLQELLGFTDEDAFKKVYQGARAGLPPELRSALDDSKGDIKSVDDLSAVLEKLFGEFGETLDSNYMVFSWGGKKVFWAPADRELWTVLSQVRKRVDRDHLDMTRVVIHALNTWLASAPADPTAV